MLADFEDVSDVGFSLQSMQAIQVDRCISRFEILVRMAKFILRDTSPSSSPGDISVYSLLFDMNVVFERFIAAELKSALCHDPIRVKYQVRGRSLLQEGNKKRFRLMPDIGVFNKHGNDNNCLIDTKWKRLNMKQHHCNVSQSDIYQMYAYGKEYDSSRVILLYPHYENLPLKVADYQHSDRDPKKKILVRTINVSQPLGDISVRKRLQESLRSIAMDA